MGIAARQIAIGGDSPDGGLTVALINRLRDAKEELPAYAWLISPGSTLISLEQRLSAKPRGDPIIHKEYLDELVDAYLAPGMDPARLPSPRRSGGSPPTLVRVSSDETLLDDAVRFASRAGTAEVAVTLEIWPRMIYAWACGTRNSRPAERSQTPAPSFAIMFAEDRAV